MPKELEDRLKTAAAKKGKFGREADRYVYGTMANLKKKKRGRQAAAVEKI